MILMADTGRKEEEKPAKKKEKQEEPAPPAPASPPAPKEKPDRKQQKAEQEAIEEKKATAKKWKGKDWYAICTPKSFGETVIVETPTTDPGSLVGRNVVVSMAELGNYQKHHIKLTFKIASIDNHRAYTRFNGLALTRDYLYRLVRKRLQKVENIFTITTKDNWELQLTTLTMLNRTTYSQIQTVIRNDVKRAIAGAAAQATIDDFVKSVIDGVIQMQVRKQESKVYPVRFSEISKIEVLKVPAG